MYEEDKITLTDFVKQYNAQHENDDYVYGCDDNENEIDNETSVHNYADAVKENIQDLYNCV